jgi:hypothetical protein
MTLLICSFMRKFSNITENCWTCEICLRLARTNSRIFPIGSFLHHPSQPTYKPNPLYRKKYKNSTIDLFVFLFLAFGIHFHSLSSLIHLIFSSFVVDIVETDGWNPASFCILWSFCFFFCLSLFSVRKAFYLFKSSFETRQK